MARNLRPARAAGLVTVWLKGSADWAAPAPDDAIDHVIDDLADWLTGVAAASASRRL